MIALRSRVFWILLVCLSGGIAQAQARYTITDMGILGKEVGRIGASDVSALNNLGQAIGTRENLPPTRQGVNRPFFYRDGKMIDLVIPGRKPLRADGINDKGEIVGHLENQETDRSMFVYRKGKVSFLPDLGDAYLLPAAINNDGVVAGNAILSDKREFTPFIYQAGKTRILPHLKSQAFRVISLNNKGHVVGNFDFKKPDEKHAFLYRDGKMEDLHLFEDAYCNAMSINDNDEIVGTCFGKGKVSRARAYLYREGKALDLGTLPGTEDSFGQAINNRGQVIGDCAHNLDSMRNAVWRPFLWENGKMVALDTLIPPNSGWKLAHASAINDKGQIAGFGMYQGRRRAFLMTPILPK